MPPALRIALVLTVIGASALVAFVVNERWLPGNYVVPTLYAIPVLIAALLLTAWPAGVIGALVLALYLVHVDPAVPNEVSTLTALALGTIGCLAVLLASDRARADRAAKEARKAHARSTFLAELSALLSTSLDYETTLANVARLAVPTLGDWCAIHMFDDDGTVRRVELAHADPAKAELVAELRKYRPVPVSARSRVTDVLRTGRAEMMSVVPDSYVGTVAQDARHREILRELGFASWLCAPMIARARIVGSITLVSGNPTRRFGPADLAIAEEVAARAALAVDNARLYREAQDAVRVRDETLTTVTHDLKTPLTYIKGTAQILRLLSERGEVDRLREGLELIESSGSRMATQIDELLDVAQLRLNRPLLLDCEPTDLVTLVRRAVERHAAATMRHRLILETRLATLVGDIDPTRLDRVLDNLLGNAIKYSPEGGEIVTTLGAEERPDGRWAILSIRDQGIGIPAADLPRVFERFHRGGNVVGRIAGTGIGLAGSRRVVEQHGGSIDVESHEGAGTTVIVSIPLRL